MAKISDISDFESMTSNITSFSHAYIFNTNSLPKSFICAKVFAKKIICNQIYDDNCNKDCDICYKIDNNIFDDLYIINPKTISINTEEIDKLMEYMKTKSLRANGNRVYIIYGYERLSRDVSNKILKFLEEPQENIYGILLTENIDNILSTIISRCQIINLYFEKDENNDELLNTAVLFLIKIKEKLNESIAYTNELLSYVNNDRVMMYDFFEVIEKIFSNIIKKTMKKDYEEKYIIKEYSGCEIDNLINILDITNNLKKLIKKNINLNLLIDRYIIEVSKEL